MIELQFSLMAKRGFKPIGYLGNKIRGAIGNAMFSLYCNKLEPECGVCDRCHACVYGDVFKNPGKTSAFPTFPAPFVIDTPYVPGFPIIHEGESLCFTITIIGQAVRWWKQVILAVKAAFENPTEIFNASFALLHVRTASDQKMIHDDKALVEEPLIAVWSDTRDIPASNDISLAVRCLSPIIRNQKNDLLATFSDFTDAIFYRIASMVDLYEGGSFTVPYDLLFRKPYIQTQIIQQDSDIREVIFQGDCMRYMPYIDVGSHLHIGKQATSGYGKFSYTIT